MMKNHVSYFSVTVISFFLLVFSHLNGIGNPEAAKKSTGSADKTEAVKSKAAKPTTKKAKQKKASSPRQRSMRYRRKVGAITKMSTFSNDGNIQSFEGAAHKLTDFIETKLQPTTPKTQKYELYKRISVIVKKAGRKNFETDGHYDAAINLVKAAVANQNKFKITAISRGLAKLQNQITKEKSTPALRDAKKAKGPVARKVQKSSKKSASKAKAPSKAKSPKSKKAVSKKKNPSKAKPKAAKKAASKPASKPTAKRSENV